MIVQNFLKDALHTMGAAILISYNIVAFLRDWFYFSENRSAG